MDFYRKLSIREAKEEIKKGISAYMQKDESGQYCLKSVNRIPFYLEGVPGIGKTEIVQQIAKELGIGFVSFSITHHTRNSLLGLPVIRDEEFGKYTEYTMSEIIAAVVAAEKECGQTEGILLLDEFNCASETIMPMMLAFLQTRNIGQYCLPEGWSIVACGNPKNYNKSARTFDAAVLDRVRRIHVDANIEDFLNYAKEQQFHDSVIEYLKVNKHNLYRCNMENGAEELVTCRGWENLSHTLKMYEQMGQLINENLVLQYIKSAEVARSFHDFFWMFRGKIGQAEIEEILTGKDTKKYEDIVNRESFEFRWKLVEQLISQIRASADTVMNPKTSLKAASVKLSRTIHFLEKLQDAHVLQERFFKEVNQDGILVNMLTKVKNEEYLTLCRKSYGELEVIENYA